MNAEIKQQWIEELPQYPRTKGKLRDKNGFCPLGVLCDLHAKKNKKRVVDIRRNLGIFWVCIFSPLSGFRLGGAEC